MRVLSPEDTAYLRAEFERYRAMQSGGGALGMMELSSRYFLLLIDALEAERRARQEAEHCLRRALEWRAAVQRGAGYEPVWADEARMLLASQPQAGAERRCDHSGIGLPGCPICDPRTVSQGGPQPEPCLCGHRLAVHGSHPVDKTYGGCFMPNCTCEAYQAGVEEQEENGNG